LLGDGDYFEVRNEFYKNVDAILFVFDVTNEKSFESLAMWLDEAKKHGLSSSSEEGCTIKVVVGNKIHLYPREVTEQQASSKIETQRIALNHILYPLTKVLPLMCYLS
jgi:GTPase SAR1 family protein